MNRPRGDVMDLTLTGEGRQPEWRRLAADPGDLTAGQCYSVLGELEAALAAIDEALDRHKDDPSTDPDWVMRAKAARRHRSRELREVAGRLLDITTERVGDGDPEHGRLAAFCAAATALLPAATLVEIWRTVARSDAAAG